MTTPTIVCAWCHVVIAAGDLAGGVSHGCCDRCVSEQLAEIDAIARAAGIDPAIADQLEWRMLSPESD